MSDAGRQMWKNEVPKVLSSHHWKNISEQMQRNNARKETWKKNEGKWNKKMGWFEMKRNKEGRPK